MEVHKSNGKIPKQNPNILTRFKLLFVKPFYEDGSNGEKIKCKILGHNVWILKVTQPTQSQEERDEIARKIIEKF